MRTRDPEDPEALHKQSDFIRLQTHSLSLEVPVPASNTFVVEPMALASRPYYAEFEMSTVRGPQWRTETGGGWPGLIRMSGGRLRGRSRGLVE